MRVVEAHIRLAVFRTEDERIANAVRSRCSLLRPPHDEFDHIPLGGLIALSIIQGEQYLKLGLFIWFSLRGMRSNPAHIDLAGRAGNVRKVIVQLHLEPHGRAPAEGF